jgi:hypothetical protein
LKKKQQQQRCPFSVFSGPDDDQGHTFASIDAGDFENTMVLMCS